MAKETTITVSAQSRRQVQGAVSCYEIVKAKVGTISEALILQKALIAYFEGSTHRHNLQEPSGRSFIPAQIEVEITEEAGD